MSVIAAVISVAELAFASRVKNIDPETMVVPDEVVEQAVEETVGMKIPVTMRGHHVGFGVISDGGAMTIDVEKNPHGEELMRMILEGTANCLSVGPFTGPIKTDI